MSRVELARIPSLTFYQGESTTFRRASALPQLVCVGKPCRLFQPEVVRCVNLGGSGTDVDWKCEADLPDSLRFGKVEVSCEGWSKPGDPYVLKGSCSLEYRLVQIPGALRSGKTDSPIFSPSGFSKYDWSSILFAILWTTVLLFIAYQLLQSCFSSRSTSSRRPPPSSRPSNSGGFSSWFPRDPRNDPPPPYSYSKPSEAGGSWWTPGFWTGAALGGLANQLWNANRNAQAPLRQPTTYDWERPATTSWFGGGSGTTRRQTSYNTNNDDRGEGSSLGTMRRSTGFGGSSVR